jgi:hypothetical protein
MGTAGTAGTASKYEMSSCGSNKGEATGVKILACCWNEVVRGDNSESYSGANCADGKGEPKAAKSLYVTLAEGGGEAGSVSRLFPSEGTWISYFFELPLWSNSSAQTSLKPAR